MSSLIPDKPFETKLSSAGLVYVHFGKKLIAQLIEKPEDHDLTEKIVRILNKYLYLEKMLRILFSNFSCTFLDPNIFFQFQL